MLKEINSEVLEKIKKELNCVGLMIIATDSQIPCPDTRAGEECTHPHEVTLAVDNLSIAACISIIMERP